MRKLISIVFLLALVLLFVTCDNYEFPESPYPRIETLSVTNISTTGVRLRGNINELSGSPITDYGFVWGFDQNITQRAGSVGIISLGTNRSAGTFEADVTSGLYKDKTYYVRAFVATAIYTVYGDPVQFKSNGSTPPHIDSIVPSTGTWGDTIQLQGSNFGTTAVTNKVKFDTQEAKVIAATETTLTCIVPDNLLTLSVPISLEVTDNLTVSESNFQLSVPIIESFSPSTGTFHDEIIITGTDFGTHPNKHLVTFDGHAAEVLQASKTSLTIKVPVEVERKTSVIKVKYNGQTATATETFILRAPLITSLSKAEGLIGDELIITGENFNPRLGGNVVYVGENQATVISATKQVLVVKIPSGIYPDRQSVVTLTVAEQTTSGNPFKLLDAWLQKGFTPQADYEGRGFQVNDLGYFISGRYTYSYTSSSNTWLRKSDFSGEARFSPIAFAIGNEGYFGFGHAGCCPGGSHSDFWRYTPASDTWASLNDLSEGGGLAVGASAGVGSKAYAIGGFVTFRMTEYDPDSDSWSAIGDELDAQFEGYPHTTHAIFTFGNRLFVYFGHTYGAVNYYLYEFELATGTWIRRNESPHYMNGGFLINGTGYITGLSYLHEYNLTTNAVTLDAIPMPEGHVTFYPLFVIDDKAYFTGPWNNGHYEFWEFDPAYR